MDYSQQPVLSYYTTIATLNDLHKIYLVQHQESKKIYVKKILDVYNPHIYEYLKNHSITGIPKVYEACEDNGRLIVIEEYISGTSLQEMTDERLLTEDLIVRIMRELCEILENLHSLTPPIVHRDIKPSNIIITPHNHVVLIDFNAAKYMTDKSSADTVLLGTKGYAAPEQYGFGSSTPKTDIYALGILLQELSASLPASTHSASACPRFDSIISECTQINPDDRPESVHALKTKFENLATDYKQAKLTPPGFRTKTPWKMLTASLAYIFIFWLCLSLEVSNASTLQLWIERISCLTIALSIVFCFFNYQNVQRFMPLCSSRHCIVRYLGAVLLSAALACTIFVIMCIITAII